MAESDQASYNRAWSQMHHQSHNTARKLSDSPSSAQATTQHCPTLQAQSRFKTRKTTKPHALTSWQRSRFHPNLSANPMPRKKHPCRKDLGKTKSGSIARTLGAIASLAKDDTGTQGRSDQCLASCCIPLSIMWRV
jgi:hypothetical protein